ncbi:MAG: aldolase/citrate lyase family protein [Sulfurovum sp.]
MIFQRLDKLPTKLGNRKKQPSTNKQQRSNMMINPLMIKHLNSIDESSADMITLNLEDGISPSRKKEALHNIALFLSYLKHSKSFIVVRTNPLGEGAEEEIDYLNSLGFDAIRIAKIKTIEDIKKALSLISQDKELHLSIETKEAFNSLSSFGISSRVTTSYLGILDLLADLGLPQSLIQLGNPTIDYILSKFLIDSKIANLHPISFMYQDYNNTKEFRAWCEREKKLGFESKASLGPKQVEIANEVFAKDYEAIERAKYIKEAFEINSQKGINGFMDKKYGFIDEPIYRDCLVVLG